MLQTPLNETPKGAAKNGTAGARPGVAAEAWRASQDLLDALGASLAGLDEEQIEARLDRDGVNEAAHEKPPHWSRQLLRTFKNPFIIVLLVLAGVELVTTPGDLAGPVIIAVMVAISVLLNFTQEYRSSKAA